jgi:hypothetical protein
MPPVTPPGMPPVPPTPEGQPPTMPPPAMPPPAMPPPAMPPPAPPATEIGPATIAPTVGNGLQLFDSPCRGVADPDVAVGEKLFGTAIQWTAYFFTRDGKMSHMFRIPQRPPAGLISDSHIVYDATTKHWFLTIIASFGGGATGVQIMASDESAMNWKFSIPIRQNRLIDDPQPTVTTDKVVITESGPCVWAVDKMALIAGEAPMVQPTRCDIDQNDQVAAIKYGPQPPAVAYAITMADNRTINWLSTEGPPGMAATTEHKLPTPAINEVQTFDAFQAGKGGFEAGEVKAMWHNGHITWSKSYHCGDVSCVRNYDVDTTNNTVSHTDYTMPGTQLFWGGTGFDKAGNRWLWMTSAKKDGFAGLAFAGKSANGMVFPATEIVKGEAAIPGNGAIRFGDYFSAAMDPVDGSTWLIGMYAARDKASALNVENSNAGCKVVKVTAK